MTHAAAEKKKMEIGLSGITVTVIFDSARSLRLRMTGSAEAELRAPSGTPYGVLESFVRQKQSWLTAQQTRMTQIPARMVYDGAIRRILGRDVTLRVIQPSPGCAMRAYRNRDTVYLLPDMHTDASALYDAFCRQEALSYFTHVAQKLYPLFAGAVPMPKLSVRKMKTRWGSCTPQNGTIRLNLYLYEAPPACVEAVVLHEMAHLLYPNHGRAFYAFLYEHMPQYDVLRRQLSETVLF